MLAQDVRLGFFNYGYPLVRPCLSIEGINIASMADIGLMKMDALISRGGRKDFYDLYFLAQKFSLEDLLDLAGEKYAGFRDFPMMVVESMVLFDNADRDLQPDLNLELPWETVKNFFVRESKRLTEKWF